MYLIIIRYADAVKPGKVNLSALSLSVSFIYKNKRIATHTFSFSSMDFIALSLVMLVVYIVYRILYSVIHANEEKEYDGMMARNTERHATLHG